MMAVRHRPRPAFFTFQEDLFRFFVSHLRRKIGVNLNSVKRLLCTHAIRSALVPDSSEPSPSVPPARGTFVRKLVRWTVAILVAALVIGGGLLWLSNRKFATDRVVIRASRLTSGNRIFPVQVAVFADHVSRYKPSLLGHTEDSITLRQVAAVKVQAGPVFADVVIDTTGGSPPVVVHGLWKKDAVTLSGAIAAAQAASPMPVRPVATPAPAAPPAPPPG